MSLKVSFVYNWRKPNTLRQDETIFGQNVIFMIIIIIVSIGDQVVLCVQIA